MMLDTGQFPTSETGGRPSEAVGTRFRLFPQAPHVSGYSKAETVWLAVTPDKLGPGPSSERVYVRDPLVAKAPYEYPYLPPYSGEVFPPAEAGFDGHFDEITPQSRQFLAAHAFASVTRVLDIWDSYVGRPISWHFAETYERLEIIPWIDWDNAQSGYGYLELGEDRGVGARAFPYALNFDVIAHEIGHAILFSLIGLPSRGIGGGDFSPFHEACADLISLLSFLHFDTGVERLLRHSNGNLLVLNELNRIAELTGDRQIRLACNQRRMSEVTEDVHDRSRPFTGAVFDTFVDQYHTILVQQGLADAGLVDIDIREVDAARLERISQFTLAAYRARPFLFKSALTEARDNVARSLAAAWRVLDADGLTFAGAAAAVAASGEQFAGGLSEKFDVNFAWREIA